MNSGLPVIPEAIAESLRSAYEEGWKSARHWPNQRLPFQLEIGWKIDDETKTLVFSVREHDLP